MANKYYVLKPFMYASKQYVRGDEFPAEELGLPSSKINVRIKAHLIIEENKLTSTEKAKLLRDRSAVKSVNKPVEKVVEQPKVEPQKEEKTEAPLEETKEEPTLFPTNNVGGGRKKRN